MALAELGFLGRGKSRHRPRNDPSLYGGPFPFVQTGEITHAEYWLRSSSQTYSGAGLAQSKLWPAGTLCITIAANIAETAVLGMEACFPDSVVGFVAEPKLASTAFVKYSLDLMKHQYKAISRGTTQDNLSVEKLNSIRLSVPPIEVQHRIAGVLVAYDNLIEVNQRRIAILEEITRRLFNEWFVRFRFPGRETAEMVETELGQLPKGWRLGCIQDISQYISRGIAPKYDEAADGQVINQKCIRDNALIMELSRRQSKPIPSLKAVAFGDVLINSTGVGTLGRVAQVLTKLENTTVDTHVTIVRASSSVNVYFFGAQLLHLEAHFERQGIGATGQTELSRTAIADTPIIIPPEGLRERFGMLVGPMRQQSELLRTQNSRLRIARDLLLPKLISGEIEIGTAEETFAEAAE